MDRKEYNNQHNDAKGYYNSRAAQFVKDYLYGNQRVLAAMKFAISQLGHRSQIHRLLDIGCGLGWTTFEMARHFPHADVQGLDMSDKLMELAKRLFHLPNLTYGKVDVLSPDVLPFKETLFDVILLIDVYEHVPQNLRPVFHDMINRMLMAKGTIIITIPSPGHQANLYSKQPDDLQPVDEVVTLMDLLTFADNIGANLHHFSYQNIWETDDYVHVALTRGQPIETSNERIVGLRIEMQLTRMIRVWRYAYEFAPSATEIAVRLYRKLTKRLPRL
jgi:cyclopropane fatty-acyl-phospholipid synthase-like methyltransferase